MELYAVRVFVGDLAAAKRFYADAIGLPLVWKSDESLGFDVGALLIVEPVGEDEDEAETLVGRFLGASLKVDDLDAVYRDLTAKGVRFTGPPETQPWGGRLAHLIDPSRNVLSLVQPS